MGQALIVASVALIVALTVLLLVQLWIYLPRDWRTAPLGQILSYTLVAFGGWVVSWLGLALALVALREWWGVRPKPLVVNAINVALIGSLIAILGAANVALWLWRRRAVPPVARQGGGE